MWTAFFSKGKKNDTECEIVLSTLRSKNQVTSQYAQTKFTSFVG